MNSHDSKISILVNLRLFFCESTVVEIKTAFLQFFFSGLVFYNEKKSSAFQRALLFSLKFLFSVYAERSLTSLAQLKELKKKR